MGSRWHSLFSPPALPPVAGVVLTARVQKLFLDECVSLGLSREQATQIRRGFRRASLRTSRMLRASEQEQMAGALIEVRRRLTHDANTL